MKRPLIALLATTLVALAGCNRGTPGGEGVTTNPPHKAPAYGEAEDTFNLSMPLMSTTLHQGESKEVAVGIKRGKNFDEDVALAFAEGPQGVTIDPANHVIKHGDTEAKVTFKAQEDASLGDFTIKVTGHPAKGADASTLLKITVAKK
jgi:uncharacterized membrane protein